MQAPQAVNAIDEFKSQAQLMGSRGRAIRYGRPEPEGRDYDYVVFTDDAKKQQQLMGLLRGLAEQGFRLKDRPGGFLTASGQNMDLSVYPSDKQKDIYRAWELIEAGKSKDDAWDQVEKEKQAATKVNVRLQKFGQKNPLSSQVFSDNDGEYSVLDLLQTARKSGVRRIPMKELLHNLEPSPHESGDELPGTPEFIARANKADRRHPGIAVQYPDGVFLADGVHRLWKANQSGKADFPVYLLQQDQLKQIQKALNAKATETPGKSSRPASNSQLEQKQAVVPVEADAYIIQGNPEVTATNPEAYSKFYAQVKAYLESKGLTAELDPGLPHTVPPGGKYWIGHSRGADRLRFAPDTVKTLRLDDYEPAEEKKRQNELYQNLFQQLGVERIADVPIGLRPVPGKSHYTFDSEQQKAIDSLLEQKQAATPDEVILVSGHSGAGKSQTANALAERLGAVHASLDQHPEFKSFIDNDPALEHLEPGWTGKKDLVALLQKLTRDTVEKAPTGAVVEGTQLAYLPKEELASYPKRVYVGGNARQILAQRLARSKQRVIDKGKDWTPEEADRRKQIGKKVYDLHRQVIEEYRRLPQTLHYNWRKNPDIEQLATQLKSASASFEQFDGDAAVMQTAALNKEFLQ